MADTIYKLIPENYSFFPVNTQAIDGAVKLLKTYIQADNISWESFNNPTFIDCGSNFESITCPYCGKTISVDLWQEMMSRCYEESNFNNLNIYLQCCSSESTLNDLKYQMDCGFARFVIEVLNPLEKPCENDLHEASKRLGKLRLKMIVARY